MESLQKPRTGSRRRIHQDTAPKEVEAPTNGLDAEAFLVWVGKLKRDNAEVENARKRRAKSRRLAKIAGMDMAVLDWVLKDLDTDPDIVLQRMATRKQYSEWLDAPGKQYSLFDLPNSAMLSHKEREEKAKRAGYAAGCMGDTPDVQAYPVDHEFHQTYMEQWHAGQKIHLDRIQPIDIALNADGMSQDSEEEAMDEAA